MVRDFFPQLAFFPGLQLANNLELDEWVVGAPGDIAWRSPSFRQQSERLLASFGSVGFPKPALVWHRTRGFDGTAIDDQAALAIRNAVRFAVLDANDHIHDKLNRGHFLGTSEHATFFRQPIDELTSAISHVEEGFWSRQMIGGYKIGERPLTLPQGLYPLARPVRVSTKLAAAVYAAFQRTDETSSRIKVALEWHADVAANAPAVGGQHRVIALKTAFEALLGNSSWQCGRLLRELFEGATAGHQQSLPWSGLVWSPHEFLLNRTFEKKKVTKSCVRSELEEWFHALAMARNAIIHQGARPQLAFPAPPERPLSRYRGHLIEVGERVCREAIKATLGPDVLLCALLTARRRTQEFIDALSGGTGTDELETPPSSRPAQATPTATARSVAEILAPWGGVAPNEVSLRPAPGTNGQFWIATCDAGKTGVDNAEAKLLRAAGAEEALPCYFEMCV